jgi:hypothetical protein
MLPTITTTHAVPQHLPPTHSVSGESIRFCTHCLRVLDSSVKDVRRAKRQVAHRCDDKTAATKPSVSIPFN